VPNQFVALGGFTIVYVILAAALAWLLLRLARTPPVMEETGPRGEAIHAVE
jgi:cytochrome bd-type quinol oxidase subunit 1